MMTIYTYLVIFLTTNIHFFDFTLVIGFQHANFNFTYHCSFETCDESYIHPDNNLTDSKGVNQASNETIEQENTLFVSVDTDQNELDTGSG